MPSFSRRAMTLLPLLVLCACAATPPAAYDLEDGEHAESCASTDDGHCVVLACDGGLCGIFECGDVDANSVAQSSPAPVVELARTYRPPAFRNWRNMGIRPGARPRMTFHFRYRQGFLPAIPRVPGKLVKHHLFPQQRELAQWFTQNGVDIHKFTMLVPEHIHRQIHSGTGRGGMWNQAWRDFMRAKRSGPLPPEVFHRKAVELIFQFELTGPVVPYNTSVAPYQHGPQFQSP
ncbi:TIGR02269 family lipoprotein [Myxococcus virescens]|uniref:SitA6 family polymorphic toxin lipoprotein n=1 Tax=Myxococcus virescens TaxID=83456 RepID=UPI003DA56F87